MKNYYEILEVDKEASFEVIDKAYKVLAKKYHPDMHPEDKKSWAEEQFKKINEAYEILSDESKRESYDQELMASTIDYSKKYEELCVQQEILKQELQDLKNRYRSAQASYQNMSQTHTTPNTNYHSAYDPSQDIHESEHIYYQRNQNNTQPNTNDIRQQEFARAYQSILSSLGYSFRQKRTFKDFLALVITIFLILFIIFILWHIPFTNQYLILFYENNSIIKGIVDFFLH